MNLYISKEHIEQLTENQNTDFTFSGETTVIRNEQKEVVGFCNMRISLVGDVIYLDELEILEQHRHSGIGRFFLKKLFEVYPSVQKIKGQSTEEAVGFYHSLGVTLYETCKECSYDECPFHPNYKGGIDKWCTDACDDYSDSHFSIHQDDIS